jgi:hypothetical protein
LEALLATEGRIGSFVGHAPEHVTSFSIQPSNRNDKRPEEYTKAFSFKTINVDADDLTKYPTSSMYRSMLDPLISMPLDDNRSIALPIKQNTEEKIMDEADAVDIVGWHG